MDDKIKWNLSHIGVDQRDDQKQSVESTTKYDNIMESFDGT